MGLYDTITAKSPIACPKCKRMCSEFQTKGLGCMLDVYTEGETERKQFKYRAAKKAEQTVIKGKDGKKFSIPFMVQTKKFALIPHPQYLRFYAYGYCECKAFVGQWFQFDTHGKLQRYGKPVVEE